MTKSAVVILVYIILALSVHIGYNYLPQPLTTSSGILTSGDVAGFWRGIWHGLIVPITFIISLFSDYIAIYEIRNNGGWYDWGFIIGFGFPYVFANS